jgi:hypothetical protein
MHRTIPIHFSLWWCVMLAPAISASAQPATTQPAPDATLDWLMNQATTAPSSPATQPAATTPPAGKDAEKDKDQKLGLRPGLILTSDGEKYRGRLSTTLDKPVRLWDDQKKEYRDIPFVLIKSIDVHVDWERDEAEWHFKESGSDIKEYTGKAYPARQTSYTITTTDGQSVTGDVVAPLYLEMPHGDPKVFVLHKRDKGDVGQTLKQLVYVQHVEFDAP